MHVQVFQREVWLGLHMCVWGGGEEGVLYPGGQIHVLTENLFILTNLHLQGPHLHILMMGESK